MTIENKRCLKEIFKEHNTDFHRVYNLFRKVIIIIARLTELLLHDRFSDKCFISNNLNISISNFHIDYMLK